MNIKFTISIIFLLFICRSEAHTGERKPEKASVKITIKDLFTPTERKAAAGGEIITKAYLKYKGLIHSPAADGNIQIPDTKYTSPDLQNYEMICIEKAFFYYDKTKNPVIYLYNILTGISRLSGMQYYSITDKKTGPFITDCYSIDSIENGKRIRDAEYNSIQTMATNYFRITDNRFGDLAFRSELYSEGDNFIVKNICSRPMKKYLVTINNGGEYQLISFFIYDNDLRGYFYCSINAMRIRSDYFLRLKMLSPESFANRIRGSTVHMAGLLGLDWRDMIMAFE